MFSTALDLLLMLLTGAAIWYAVHEVITLRKNSADRRLGKQVDYFVEACSREAKKMDRKRKVI